MKLSSFLIPIFVLLACQNATENKMLIDQNIVPKQTVSYLALGDSYTIGEAVKQEESFPFQLVAELSPQINVGMPRVIAKTGWTTDELQTAIKAENINKTYDLVTLLIGVNNQYRGYSEISYRKEFKELLQQAIDFAGGNKQHVFVISIPDWGVTPFGLQSGKSTATIAKEIDEFNAINKEETLAQQIAYIDITAGSRNATVNSELIAADGLHPSAKMYSEWVNKLAEAIRKIYN